MTEHRVLLYVYDLSQGMAAAMSLQLTGKFIPGIWHTSVTIPDFNIEVFFGQGISIVAPGTSHHGQPHKTEDLGTTSIDKDTFMEYIEGIREMYTSERYHLLDFNCNNFTQDVASFLTGNSIPQDITDLPKEFLSTPFGQSLRPMIENMYTGGYRPDASQAVPGLVNDGLRQTAPGASHHQQQPSQDASSSSNSNPAAQGLTSPLTVCSNLASFQNLLSSNDAFVVMFTSASCPPCRTIKPIFEDVAMQHAPTASSSLLPKLAQQRVAFAIVDTSIGREVSANCSISATPTFQFYLKGQRSHELKSSDPGELKMQTALLIDAAYPAHPHKRHNVKELRRLASASVDFASKPNFDAALSKLQQSGAPSSATAALRNVVVPFLSADEGMKAGMPAQVSREWQAALEGIFTFLPQAEWFPAIDLLRFAAAFTALKPSKVVTASSQELMRLLLLPEAPKPDKTWIVAFRLCTNMLPSMWLEHRGDLSEIIIEGLLHASIQVRTAAATCAFRAVQLEFGRRVEWTSDGFGPDNQEEWETETLTACLEALGSEGNPDTVHRLLATIGLLILFSPHFEALQGIAEALEGPSLVEDKGKLLRISARDHGAQAQVREVLTLVKGT